MLHLIVPNTNVEYKLDGSDQLVSPDGGEHWYFTFRGPEEFMAMWPEAIEKKAA